MTSMTSVLPTDSAYVIILLFILSTLLATIRYLHSDLNIISVRPNKSLWAGTVKAKSEYFGLIRHYITTLRRGFKETHRNVKSFYWVAPLVLVIGLGIPQFLQPLSTYSQSQVATLWQAQATLIGVSFVVIVFVLEYLQDQHYDVSVRNRFIGASNVIPLLFFSMISLLIVGWFYLFGRGPIAMNGSVYLVALNIIAIGYTYGRITSIAFRDPLDSFLMEQTKESLEAIEKTVQDYKKAHEILDQTNGVTTGNLQSQSVTTEIPTSDTITTNYIADINLQKISLHGETDRDPVIQIDLRRPLPDAIRISTNVADEESIRESLKSGVLSHNENRWQPRLDQFEQQLEQLRRFADDPIESGNKSEFDKYVDAHKVVGQHAMLLTSSLDENIQKNVIELFNTNIQGLFESTNTAVDLHFARQLLDIIEEMLEEARNQNNSVFHNELLWIWFECYTIDRQEYQSRRLIDEPLRPLEDYLEDITNDPTSEDENKKDRTMHVYAAIQRCIPVVIETLDFSTINKFMTTRKNWERRLQPQVQRIADEELLPNHGYSDEALYFTAKQLGRPIGQAVCQLRQTTFLLAAAGLAHNQASATNQARLESTIESIISDVFTDPAETREILIDLLNAEQSEWTAWKPTEWHTNVPSIRRGAKRNVNQTFNDVSDQSWIYEFYALTQLVHMETQKDVPRHDISGESLSADQQSQLNEALSNIKSETPLETQFSKMYQNMDSRQQLVNEEADGRKRW